MVAQIGRVQVILTGFSGAPGLMNFYWNGASTPIFTTADATAAIAATHTLLGTFKTGISGNVTMSVSPVVECFDAATGALLGVVSGTPVGTTVGTGTGTILSAEGPLLQWITGVVAGRRLIRGRTFITPSSSSCMDVAGTVNGTFTSAALAGGAAYIATTPQNPVIWHRPKPYATGGNGVAAVITACSVPLKVAVLRSRRD